MDTNGALDLLRPAIARRGGRWADLGAGDGMLTTALARLIGPDGKITAVDRDARTLRALAAAGKAQPEQSLATIEVIEGDLDDLENIDGLGNEFDGILLANVLHFFVNTEDMLTRACRLLKPTGTIVIVEYEGASPSRWVPYPVPIARLTELAAQSGLNAPKLVSERDSRYRGKLYCAVATRSIGIGNIRETRQY